MYYFNSVQGIISFLLTLPSLSDVILKLFALALLKSDTICILTDVGKVNFSQFIHDTIFVSCFRNGTISVELFRIFLNFSKATSMVCISILDGLLSRSISVSGIVIFFTLPRLWLWFRTIRLLDKGDCILSLALLSVVSLDYSLFDVLLELDLIWNIYDEFWNGLGVVIERATYRVMILHLSHLRKYFHYHLVMPDQT